MAENLKTTKYRNGDPISNPIGGIFWWMSSVGAYCWYTDDSVVNKSLYGALYNWYAVTDSRNIAPTGWHIPSSAEVSTLSTFLGGETVAGGKLKEQGLEHWLISNSGATNSSGFSSMPGGMRGVKNYENGVFDYINVAGYWWTTSSNPLKFSVASSNDDVIIYNSGKTDGLSVRCIKD
jgi:uncharacterized protein (TIGR02145 family)